MREVAVVPGEPAGLKQNTRDGGSMTSDELGCRMHDDVGAMFKWTTQEWCGKGVVYHQGNTGLMSNIGNGTDIEHIAARIADGLTVEGAGARSEGATIIFGIGTIHEDRMNAPGTQSQVELCMGTPVEAAGGDEVISWAQ